MRPSRSSRHARRLISGWLVAALLFMQFAVAAHACQAAGRAAAVPHPVAALKHAPGCHGGGATADGAAPDADSPHLCKAHCQQGAQTPGVAPLADAPSTSWLPVATLDWTQAALTFHAPAPSAGQQPALRSGAPPPGTPPLFLSLLVLRR